MRRLLIDTAVVAASIILAVYFVRADIVHQLVSFTSGSILLASFVAGLFFTSVFTTAPATVLLGELAQHASLWQIAVAGALGATVTDMAMYIFFSKRLSHHAKALAAGKRFEFVRHALAHSRLRFVLSVIGALIIALPLPDELGLMLLGVSSVNRRTVLLLSLAFNALGILAIGLAARAFFVS